MAPSGTARRLGTGFLAALGVTFCLVGCSRGPNATRAVSSHLGDCAARPVTCNAGTRAAGGQITWLIEQPWGGTWNAMRTEGGSYYLRQALAGIAPEVGDFAPDGTWKWNNDLLASPPEVINQQPLTIVYRIRPQALWSDGVPVTTDDFLYNWYHNSGRPDQCDGCAAFATSGWAQLASITGSENGATVTVTFQAGIKDPEWFAQLGPSEYPAHIAQSAGFDWRTPKGMGASSAYFAKTIPTWSAGPYVIKSATADERVIMVGNPRWYGATRPTLTTIVKEVISNQSSWPLALKNGELDGGAPLAFDPDIYQQIGRMAGVSTAIGAGGSTWEQVDVNLHGPSLGDIALRKAIFTVLDTTDARARIFGTVAPALRTSHVFATASPYHLDELAGTGYGTGDATAARRILQGAGYTGFEAGQTLSKDGQAIPALRFAYLSGNTERATYVQLAQSYLGAIGLKVTPVQVPGPQFGATLKTHAFDLVIFAFGGGPLFTSTVEQLFSSHSSVNFAGLNNPQIDQLASQIADQTNLPDSARLSNQADKLVMDEASMLPLWDNPSYTFASNRFVGLRDDLNSSVRAMYNIKEWGLAKNRSGP